jgi:lipopolysaccharide export system protein LptA
MSTPRSICSHARIDLVALLLAALGICGIAQAKQSDRDQPVELNAHTLVGTQTKGRLVVSGNVTIDQGTFHADGDRATAYKDVNGTSQWQRVVLTGSPAHFRQMQDNGTEAHGHAQTLDYRVSENTVILTGNATVVQEGQGTFRGDKLTYNTDTGAIQGNATPGSRVHITLQPRSKPASTSAKPAPANSPASAASIAPASASSAGTH